MAKRALLQGLMVQPVVYVLDDTDDTMEQHPTNQMFVAGKTLHEFVEIQWPVQWDSIKHEIEQADRAAANDEVTARRAARKATTPRKPRAVKKAAAKKATAKR